MTSDGSDGESRTSNRIVKQNPHALGWPGAQLTTKLSTLDPGSQLQNLFGRVSFRNIWKPGQADQGWLHWGQHLKATVDPFPIRNQWGGGPSPTSHSWQPGQPHLKEHLRSHKTVPLPTTLIIARQASFSFSNTVFMRKGPVSACFCL